MSSPNAILAEAARARFEREGRPLGSTPSRVGAAGHGAARDSGATSVTVRSAPPPSGAPSSQGFSWFRGIPSATTPSVSDAELAGRLQREEYLLSQQQHQQGAQQQAQGADADIAGKAYMDDPVWGRWVSARSHPPKLRARTPPVAAQLTHQHLLPPPPTPTPHPPN